MAPFSAGAGRVVYQTPDMRRLVFDNPPGRYPVNRYQSLLLAGAAHVEALEAAARSARPLDQLRALEVCCGGGPAAIALKHAGLAYVGASDILADSLDQLRRNAELNQVSIDSLRLGGGLAPWRARAPRFDVIACNPPCLPAQLLAHGLAPALRTATCGGAGGVAMLAALIDDAEPLLRAQGRFVFLLTSTADFGAVEARLNARYAGRWRVSPGLPLAAPYCRESDAVGARLLALREDGLAFVWRGGDGWLWRLTWAVAVLRAPLPAGAGAALELYPVGFVPHTADYRRAMLRWGRPLPDSPAPPAPSHHYNTPR